MRKITTKIIAGALSVLTVFTPVTTLAANSGDYVSEVYISSAKDEQTAKDYLSDNGYEIFNNNLNDGTDKNPVYLGYKTTKNPKQAITDLKVMDMNGGYSQTDYEKMVEDEKAGIKENVSELRVVIDEFRKNYNAGEPLALYAYNELNKYKDQKEDSNANLKCDEGKTDKLMGDYFLDESVTDDQMATLFLQGNATVFEALYQNLALGTFASGDETVIEKLLKVDPDADFDAGLDDTAKLITDSWGVMFGELEKYENGDVKITDDESTVKEYLETLNDTEKQNFVKYGTLYEMLDKIEFGTDTMLDYFMHEDVKAKDVYPLASVLTPAQAVILPHIGLANLLLLNGDKSSTDEAENFITDVTKSSNDKDSDSVVSVYYNVDQNLFNGNVALTSEALSHQNASGDSPWYDTNVGEYVTLGVYAATAFGVGLMAVSGLIKTAKISKLNHLQRLYDSSKEAYNACKSALEADKNLYEAALNARSNVLLQGSAPTGEDMQILYENYSNSFDTYKSARNVMDMHYDAYEAYADSASGAGWVFTAATGIILIAQGINIGMKVYNYYHPEYLQIPQIICDARISTAKDDKVETNYYYYYAAKGHIAEDSKGKYGEYGDLNGFTGKQWNALYTTKDENAGSPVLANSLTVKLGDNSVDKNAVALSLFQTSFPYNVNAHQYKDKQNGIYISFKCDESVNSTASIFTSGKVALVAGVSVAVGIIIGTACVTLATKKSKKSNQSTTTSN